MTQGHERHVQRFNQLTEVGYELKDKDNTLSMKSMR